MGGSPTLELGKDVRGSAPKEEGVEETTCDELTRDSTPCLPAPLGERRQRIQE